MNKFLTVADVADMMQVNRKTVYKWVSDNLIPYTKLPSGSVRFEPTRLENWIKNRTARVIQS